MANSGIIDVSTGAAQAIGRYFSVISVVPSSLYVVFVYTLITSGSWQHSPNWSHAFKSLEQLGVGGIVFLAFLSIALGVIIHPAQFAIVQFFEGYWGNTPIAQTIRSQRILRYQRLCQHLGSERTSARRSLSQMPKADVSNFTVRTPLLSRRGEADRVRDSFPRALDHVMPTRLGNVLRRTESQAGRQYGLDAVIAVPHLLMIAPSDHVEYVSDQRSQLDLAVRMTFISALASATAILFLWPYRWWVLIAIIPYAIAYLSYRGSVVAASHYGSALDTLINLDRFALYEQLHLGLPDGTVNERETNKELTRLFGYDHNVVIVYQHPAGEGNDAIGGIPIL
jgi:hypothetical protein